MIGSTLSKNIEDLEDYYCITSEFPSCKEEDLYDLLLHEPTSTKKPSILYDYSPSPTAMISDESLEFQSLTEKSKSQRTSSQTDIAVRKCTCSKTRCQKNYCQCFKQGLVCTSECECVSCCNTIKLFSAKCSTDGRGCTCQKSKCQKNYCECHMNGKKCGASCKCLDCQNIDLPQDCLDLSALQKPSKRRKTSGTC